MRVQQREQGVSSSLSGFVITVFLVVFVASVGFVVFVGFVECPASRYVDIWAFSIVCYGKSMLFPL